MGCWFVFRCCWSDPRAFVRPPHQMVLNFYNICLFFVCPELTLAAGQGERALDCVWGVRTEDIQYKHRFYNQLCDLDAFIFIVFETNTLPSLRAFRGHFYIFSYSWELIFDLDTLLVRECAFLCFHYLLLLIWFLSFRFFYFTAR